MPIGHHIASERTDRRSERGASLVEYALLIALIAVVCIGSLVFLGSGSNSKLNSAATGLGGGGQTEQQFENACADAGNTPVEDVTTTPYQLECREGPSNYGAILSVYKP
jgi:pilus assembly protein Flp/PilA